MHSASIHTEYYQQNQGPLHNNIYPTSLYTASYKKQSKTSSTTNLQKIEQNLKQYQQQIRNNKDTIHQLQCQRKFFEKLSEKQMIKIQQIDIDKIKSEYENKIFKLKNQTAQLHQRIACFNQSIQQNDISFKQTCLNLTTNKQFLLKAFIQLEKENQNYQRIILHEEKTLQQLQQEIKENQKIIQDKQAAYRKYIGIQIEIQQLQKKLASKNDKK